MLGFIERFLITLGATLVIESVRNSDFNSCQVIDEFFVFFFDGEDAFAALDAFFVEEFVLPLVEFFL